MTVHSFGTVNNRNCALSKLRCRGAAADENNMTGEPSIMSVHCLPIWSHVTLLIWASITGFKWNWPPPPSHPSPFFFSPFLFFEKFLIVFCITETYTCMHTCKDARTCNVNMHIHTVTHTDLWKPLSKQSSSFMCTHTDPFVYTFYSIHGIHQ